MISKATPAIKFFVLLFLFLQVTVSSCTRVENEAYKIENNSSDTLPDWVEILYEKIQFKLFTGGIILFWDEVDNLNWNAKDYKNIWISLMDTTEPFSVLMTKVEKIGAVEKPYDLYYALGQVMSIKYFQSELFGNLESNDSLNVAIKKINENIEYLYDSDIVYNCLAEGQLSSRVVFLSNGEARVYSSFIFSHINHTSWSQNSGIVYYTRGDTIVQYSVEDDCLLPYPSGNGRRMVFLK